MGTINFVITDPGICISFCACVDVCKYVYTDLWLASNCGAAGPQSNCVKSYGSYRL